MVSTADLTRIHDASVKILQETGVVFHHAEALEIFKSHGARVSGELVRIPRKMIEQALSSAPSQFKLTARDDQHSFVVGDRFPAFYTCCARGIVYVYDMDRGTRVGTLNDHVNITRLMQASQVMNIAGGYASACDDIAADDKHLHIIHEVLKHTNKPIHVFTGFKNHHVTQVLEMIAIVMGKEFLAHHHCAITSGTPKSPLAFSGILTEGIIRFSEWNQVVSIPPCIMPGVTGPIRLLGTAVLTNTEILAAIVLAQLVRPGCPVIMEPCGSPANMKNASFIGGTPEMMLMNIPVIQMGLELYHLPTRSIVAMNETKCINCQTGYEAMQNMLLPALSGCHLFDGALGQMNNVMTIGYEKTIIDEELVKRAKRICEGIDTSDESLAVDLIQEIGHAGAYLTHESTFEHFRKRWQPSISDWESTVDYQKAATEDITIKANREWKKRLSKAPDSLLDPEIDQALVAYMQNAKKKNKG